MPEVTWLLSELTNLRSIIDILVVTVIIYWVLWVAQGTRATVVLRGAVILLVLAYVLASSLSLTTLNWMLASMWPALFIAIPVIFQPEIRRALEQLGHTGSWLRTIPANDVAITERMIDEVVRASAQLARLRFGALIVIERETGLQDYADRGVPEDAILTRQTLIQIFTPNTPLHDGAVIVRQNRILAAACVLPLTDAPISGTLGTRHRAAVGIS